MIRIIFFLVCIAKSIKTQTITLSPGPTVNVSVDQSLTLTCTTTYSARFISFFDSTLNTGTVAITLGIINGACQTLAQSTGYDIQCDSVNGPFILTINSVTRQHHNSKIKCSIQYGSSATGDIASDVTTILVNVPLVISELTPSGIVTKKTSNTVSFKCVVSGFPKPTVTWLINGSAPMTQSPPIESYQNEIATSEMTYVAQKADNGKMITCTADNGKHTVSASTALNIQYRPIVTISPNNSLYHVIVNSTNFQLTCNVIDTNPDVTSFSWTKNGSTNQGSASYTIPAVYRSHAGSYSCSAANTVGNSVPSASIQLSVLYGTEIILISKKEPTEGTQLLITCDGQSNPAVTDNDVTWTKQNNNTFSSKGKQFVVGNLNRVDSGTYVCSVVIKLTPTVGQSIDITSRTTVDVDVLCKQLVKDKLYKLEMRILFCSLYLLFLNTVTTEHTIEPALLETALGSIKGIKGVFTDTGDILYEFRGIPFGKPPVGSLRFKKPVPFGFWKETLNATAFRSACLQNIPDFMPELSRPTTSEDCLFLNVYVPKSLDKLSNFSVMVWIHGGGFEVGFGNEDDLSRMAIEGDVVMVSFNYRLGIFGFLAIDHPAARGNYALWDQKLALQWVHDNIEMFGGNPNSVTIFGESAGGYSVSLQSLISTNNGLFHRAIAQSGVHSKILMRKQDEVQEYTNQLSKKSLCPLEDEYKFVDCLRKKSVEELLEIADFYSTVSEDKLKKHIFFKSHSYPVVDGELFTENPIVSLEDKTSAVSQFFGSLDFISGTTSNEGSLLYLITFPELQEFYRFNVTEGVPHKVACEAIIAPYVEKYLRSDDSIKKQMCNFYQADASTKEQSLRATELLADVMFTYPSIEMLEFHAALKHGKTYQYLFSKTSPDPFGGPPPEWFEGSGHGDDLIWLFKVDNRKQHDEL